MKINPSCATNSKIKAAATRKGPCFFFSKKLTKKLYAKNPRYNAVNIKNPVSVFFDKNTTNKDDKIR